MKRFLSITLAITTTLWLVGTMFVVPAARAAVVDGDVVSPDATFVDADGNTYYPYDVFIVKLVGTKTFKRLVLNPQVFDSYGHLKWSNIKTISAATVKGYTTSSIVREINDTKVYKLSPNGDLGTKQWVETLACFNSKSYDWDSVYIINATDRDNYTTGASICGGGAAEGPITLSLASDNPPAATLPLDAQGVSFLKVKIDGTGTINQITIARKGAGEVDDFGDIYIYKDGTRVGSGRSLSSATSKVTFINLGIAAPATFEVVADMATDNAGNVSYFAIETSSDVTGTGTVGGVFPINGNPMASSNAAAGTVTVTASGSGSRNVTVGGTEQEISQFKIAVATEGGYLKRVRLYNSGTADNDKITNLKLKDNTEVTVATATSIASSGYLDFILSSPYYIKKGDSEIFRVYADIGGVKPTYTIILYLELATDILATGNIYGYGLAAAITGFDTAGTTATEAINVTCVGGDLTLNKVGPNADNIGTDTDDTVFLEYSMTAAADITVKRTELIFCWDDSGGTGASYSDASANAGADITDIKVIDKDSGTTILGPKDGIAFDNNGAAGAAAAATAGYQACPGNADGLWEAFTDTFDISAGQKRNFQVTADIDISATNSGTVLTTTDVVKFMLYSYASMVGTSGNVSYMKYAGTTDAVDDSVIVPSGNIAGEGMTIEAPSLVVTLAATPSGNDAAGTEKVYIAGQSGVEAIGFIFTAGAASDVTINTIQLTGYIGEATGVALAAGVDTNYVKDSIGAVSIYDTTTGALIPGSGVEGFTGTANVYEDVDYTGLSWTIPAGESRTMLVKVNISSASPASAAGADTWIGFDILDVSDDISAVDKDGTSVVGTGDASNPLAATVNFGIADYGSIAIAVASDTPDKSLLVMGTNDNAVSKFKLTGTYEAWKIEKFAIGLYDGNAVDTNAESDNRDNFSGVALKYQTESQWGTSNWTISSKKTFEATASLAFNFSDDNRIYVPKDDDTYITVLVDVKGYLGGTGAKSKVPVMINHSTSELTGFKAYGAQSGTQKTTLTTTTVPNTSLALHFVARSKPVFAKSAWSGVETELARFTITATGYDVVFNGDDDNAAVGDIGSASLRFDVIASSGQGTDTVSESGVLTLYDWTEAAVSSDTVTYGLMDVDTTDTSTSFGFELKDITIPSGTTKEFHVDLAGSDLTDFNNTDEYIYLKFTNDAAAFANLATDSWSTPDRSVVWDDGTLEEGLSGGNSADGRYGMPEDIMNIGTLPLIFRTLRGTTQ